MNVDDFSVFHFCFCVLSLPFFGFSGLTLTSNSYPPLVLEFALKKKEGGEKRLEDLAVKFLFMAVKVFSVRPGRAVHCIVMFCVSNLVKHLGEKKGGQKKLIKILPKKKTNENKK